MRLLLEKQDRHTSSKYFKASYKVCIKGISYCQNIVRIEDQNQGNQLGNDYKNSTNKWQDVELKLWQLE